MVGFWLGQGLQKWNPKLEWKQCMRTFFFPFVRTNLTRIVRSFWTKTWRRIVQKENHSLLTGNRKLKATLSLGGMISQKVQPLLNVTPTISMAHSLKFCEQ